MQAYATPTAAGANTGNTAETVVATLSGVFIERPGQLVILDAWAAITTGANTTGVRYRLRRGTDTSGTLVGDTGVLQISTAAGSSEDHTVTATDSPAEGGPYSYVLTIAQTAGTAAGVIPACSVQAIVSP